MLDRSWISTRIFCICTEESKDSPKQGNLNISWSHLNQLQLADPTFNTSGPIDAILGVQVFSAALLTRVRKGVEDQPSAIETVFGWVVIGTDIPTKSK